MSYMVIFRTPDGKPGYQQAEGPQDVVETVERLRNEDGVENVRIYRMDEVAFEYKVHYTVELKDPNAAGDAPAAPVPSSAESLSWDDETEAAAEPSEPSPVDAPIQPFDQMAAMDTSEPPRWGESDEAGEPGGAISIEDDTEDAAAGARRGLFGR